MSLHFCHNSSYCCCYLQAHYVHNAEMAEQYTPVSDMPQTAWYTGTPSIRPTAPGPVSSIIAPREILVPTGALRQLCGCPAIWDVWQTSGSGILHTLQDLARALRDVPHARQDLPRAYEEDEDHGPYLILPAPTRLTFIHPETSEVAFVRPHCRQCVSYNTIVGYSMKVGPTCVLPDCPTYPWLSDQLVGCARQAISIDTSDGLRAKRCWHAYVGYCCEVRREFGPPFVL